MLDEERAECLRMHKALMTLTECGQSLGQRPCDVCKQCRARAVLLGINPKEQADAP